MLCATKSAPASIAPIGKDSTNGKCGPCASSTRTIKPRLCASFTIFTMSTGEIEVESDLTLLGSLATEVVEKSIINAIKNAKSIQNIVSYKELQESK